MNAVVTATIANSIYPQGPREFQAAAAILVNVAIAVCPIAVIIVPTNVIIGPRAINTPPNVLTILTASSLAPISSIIEAIPCKANPTVEATAPTVLKLPLIFVT